MIINEILGFISLGILSYGFYTISLSHGLIAFGLCLFLLNGIIIFKKNK